MSKIKVLCADKTRDGNADLDAGAEYNPEIGPNIGLVVYLEVAAWAEE